MRRTHAFGAAISAALALALPVSLAGAHPAVYQTTQQLAKYNEVQTLALTADDGTFKPSSGAPAIPHDAQPYVVAWALAQDPAIGANATTFVPNVDVSLTAGALAGNHTYTLRFQGDRAGTDIGAIGPDDALLTDGGGAGAIVANEVVAGSATTLAYTGNPTLNPDANVSKAVISNDGFVVALTEANSLGGNGWLNLQKNPGTYRTSETNAQWIEYPTAQTSFQTHATCWDNPNVMGDLDLVLNTVANRIAAQKDKEGQVDSFFNYVPWQSTSGGLEDQPSQWIGLVKTATGQDLTGATTAQAKAKCEAAGGIFVPADTAGSNPATKYGTEVADEAVKKASTPLNAAIASLTTTKTTLEAQVAALQKTIDAANKVDVAPMVRTNDEDAGAVVLLNGPAGSKATVTLTVPLKTAKALGLKSGLLGSASTKLNANGSAAVQVRPSLKVRKALGKRKAAVTATVTTKIGATTDTATIVLK